MLWSCCGWVVMLWSCCGHAAAALPCSVPVGVGTGWLASAASRAAAPPCPALLATHVAQAAGAPGPRHCCPAALLALDLLPSCCCSCRSTPLCCSYAICVRFGELIEQIEQASAARALPQPGRLWQVAGGAANCWQMAHQQARLPACPFFVCAAGASCRCSTPRRRPCFTTRCCCVSRSLALLHVLGPHVQR